MVENGAQIFLGDGSEKGISKEVIEEAASTHEVRSHPEDAAVECPTSLSPGEQRRLWRKIDMRLMPILTVMYLCSFVDRGNIGTSVPTTHGMTTHDRPGNAKLEGLTTQLQLTGNKYNVALVSVVPFSIGTALSRITDDVLRSMWPPRMSGRSPLTRRNGQAYFFFTIPSK